MTSSVNKNFLCHTWTRFYLTVRCIIENKAESLRLFSHTRFRSVFISLDIFMRHVFDEQIWISPFLSYFFSSINRFSSTQYICIIWLISDRQCRPFEGRPLVVWRSLPSRWAPKLMPAVLQYFTDFLGALGCRVSLSHVAPLWYLPSIYSISSSYFCFLSSFENLLSSSKLPANLLCF